MLVILAAEGRVLGDAGLEQGVLPAQLQGQRTGLEEVGQAEEELGVAKGLGQEVVGSEGEGSLSGRVGDVGGQHDHRDVAVVRDQGGETGHHLEPVEARHVEIEQHQVRLEAAEPFHGHQGIVDRQQVRIAGLLQHVAQHRQVRLLVVDDQDADLRAW